MAVDQKFWSQATQQDNEKRVVRCCWEGSSVEEVLQRDQKVDDIKVMMKVRVTCN